MAPSFCLPPVDFCNGVSPSQAAKSRPARKPSGAGTRAVIAVAAIGPMPGIVMSRRATGSALACRAISPSSSLSCSSKRRFSELTGEAVCNQEYASGLEQRLDDEAEPVVAQSQAPVFQDPGIAAFD